MTKEEHMKECTKPHTMLHSFFGLGLGMLLVGLLPGILGANAVLIGIVVMVVVFGLDLMMMKGKEAAK